MERIYMVPKLKIQSKFTEKSAWILVLSLPCRFDFFLFSLVFPFISLIEANANIYKCVPSPPSINDSLLYTLSPSCFTCVISWGSLHRNIEIPGSLLTSVVDSHNYCGFPIVWSVSSPAMTFGLFPAFYYNKHFCSE